MSWSQRLTRREGDGFAQVGLNIGGTPFIDWLARNNGKVLSDDGTRVAFDQPAGQATLEWMLDATQRLYGSQQAYADALRKASPTPPTPASRTSGSGRRRQFFIVLNDGPKANPAFKPAVSIVPHNAQNAQARPLSLAEKIWMYSQAGGTSGPRLDAGYDFLRFLTTGEGNKAFVLAQGRPSPVVKVNDDPAFKQANPWWDTVVKQGLSLMTPMAQTPAWNSMRGALDRMTARVLAGQQGVREALAERRPARASSCLRARRRADERRSTVLRPLLGHPAPPGWRGV